MGRFIEAATYLAAAVGVAYAFWLSAIGFAYLLGDVVW